MLGVVNTVPTSGSGTVLLLVVVGVLLVLAAAGVAIWLTTRRRP